jgi:hypothetical protein
MVRVESRWLDGEPFMPEGYGMTRDWGRCQRIRRALIKAASERRSCRFVGDWNGDAFQRLIEAILLAEIDFVKCAKADPRRGKTSAENLKSI